MSTTNVSINQGPIRVLHVDDEPDFAQIAAQVLQRQNEQIDVKTSAGASDGMDRLQETEFDRANSDSRSR